MLSTNELSLNSAAEGLPGPEYKLEFFGSACPPKNRDHFKRNFHLPTIDFQGIYFFQGNNEISNDPSYSAKKTLSPLLVQPQKNTSLKGVTLPLLVKAE